MKTFPWILGFTLFTTAATLTAQNAPAAAAPVSAAPAAATARPFAPQGREAARTAPRRTEEPLELEKSNSFYDLLVAEKLSVGAVYVQTKMDKTHVPFDPSQEGNFLGNINNLEEDEMGGLGFVVRYNLCRYVGLQVSSGTHIELGMWNNEHESRDANFVADGMTYELLLMCPIDAIRTTPFIGLGMTKFSCEIDYNNWWHYGWSSPRDYDAYGHGSTENRNGTSRWMKLTDEPSDAFSFTAGLSFRLFRYAQVDVFYRTIDMDDCLIEFDRKAANNVQKMRSGYVPLKCSSYGVALRAVF